MMTNQPMISCEEALRELAAYLDDELSATHAQSVAQHLDRCRSCYSRAEFERRLKGELSTLGKMPVQSDFEQRIRALISSFDPS
jgi:anti-sigma factor RsiW